MPGELEDALGKFVEFYNHRGYHKAVSAVIPAGVLAGKQDEILGRRNKVRAKTIARRKQANGTLRQQLSPA